MTAVSDLFILFLGEGGSYLISAPNRGRMIWESICEAGLAD